MLTDHSGNLFPFAFNFDHLNIKTFDPYGTALDELAASGVSVPVKPPNLNSRVSESPDYIEAGGRETPVDHHRPIEFPEGVEKRLHSASCEYFFPELSEPRSMQRLFLFHSEAQEST